MSEFSALVSNGLKFEGPDQGIDFTGSGVIFAPVDIEITRIDLHSSWPGGHVIAGHILNHHWYKELETEWLYFAEALVPIHGLHVGQRVNHGHWLAQLHSSFPGTEIGLAQNAHGLPFGTPKDGKPGGPEPIHGLRMEAWIKELSKKHA